MLKVNIMDQIGKYSKNKTFSITAVRTLQSQLCNRHFKNMKNGQKSTCYRKIRNTKKFNSSALKN
jgi:hypothetical protein